MKLRKAIISYIAYKRSLGMRMRNEERVLGFFYNAMSDIELDRADPQAVLAFIGDATRPGRWRTYYGVVGSFYRYALERGYAHRWTCQKFCVRGGFQVFGLVNRSPYNTAN